MVTRIHRAVELTKLHVSMMSGTPAAKVFCLNFNALFLPPSGPDLVQDVMRTLTLKNVMFLQRLECLLQNEII